MCKRLLILISLLLLGGASYGQRVVGNPNVVTLDLGGWSFGNYLQAPATLEIKPGRDYCHTFAIVHDTVFIYSCALGKWIPASGSGGVSTVHGINGITINGGDTVDGKLKMNIADSATGYVTHATFLDSLRGLFDRNVISVNGLTGQSITLITDNISEGASNLWFTDSRAIDANIAQIADSVRGRVKYIDSLTIYATPKNVKDSANSVRSAIPTNNNQLTNGSNYATTTAVLDSVHGRQTYGDTLTFDVTISHLNVILAGYLTAEVDPIFTASPSYGISNGNITNWNTAYNKYITGLGFSGGTLTLTRNDATTLTQSLDGRYIYFTDTSGWSVTLAHLNTVIAGYVATSRTISTTGPLSGGGDLSANRTLSITQADATHDGYLSSIHWNLFNGKQDALSGTGFVKITGTTISYDNSTYLTTAGAASTYVPFSGSPSNVDLGSHSLYLTGTIGIGTTSPRMEMEVISTSTLTPRGMGNTQINNASSSAQFNYSKARGVVGSLLAVISGDVIGRSIFNAYDGTSYIPSAEIRATVTNTVTTNSIPSQLAFYTSTNAVPSVMTERLRIGAAGDFNYFGSTSGTYTFLLPAAITSYTVTPPSAVGSAGQVQSISSVSGNSATMGWITPLTSFSVTASSTFSVTGSPITGGTGTINIAFAPTTVFTITPANSVTVDANNGNSQTITMNRATTTFTISNILEGRQNAITLEVLQDGTGSRGLAMSTTVKVPNNLGGLPPISTTANAIDVWTIQKIHGNIWVFVALNGN